MRLRYAAAVAALLVPQPVAALTQGAALSILAVVQVLGTLMFAYLVSDQGFHCVTVYY